MDAEVQKYAYLWDGSQPWVLVLLGESASDPRYVILDTSTNSALIIEDDQLDGRVQRQMLQAGVRVVLPKDVAGLMKPQG